MFEEPHHLEFSEDAFAADQALKHIRKFLQSDALAVPRVCDGPDHAEGPVPDGSVRLEVCPAAGAARAA